LPALPYDRFVRTQCIAPAVVAQRERIEIGEKVFAEAEENRADSEMQFVDETNLEILADCGDTPAKPNILPVSRLAGAL
jgi:hypothetical protein